MKKPNFFILGAPKCGTTSLATWLSEHPQVYFSPIKEPHYFNFDYGERACTSLLKYEQLFSDVKEHHLAVGEASTGYLYSQTAVPAILSYVREVRFIVMARDPVDMAHARYDQLVFDGQENEKDFERAWELQPARMHGAQTPVGVDPQQLLYGPVCRLGEQINRLFKIVPRCNILMLNLEHLQNDPYQAYQRTLAFLGLNDDGRQEFPVINKAKRQRFPGIWNTVRWTNRTLRAVGVPQVRLGITEFIHSWDRKERPRPPMSEAMRNQLREYFSDDVRLLEELTGWDLKHWRTGS